MSARSSTSAREPSVFVSYRRADDPFAAALVAAALLDRFGTQGVFLDTLALRPRSDPSRRLPQALARSTVLLALIGSRWDQGEQLRRLRDAQDWVRWEITEAARLHMTIIPAFLGRSADLNPDVPHDLRDLLTRQPPSAIRRTHLRTDLTDLVDRIITGPDAPPAATPAGRLPVGEELDAATIRTGIDAMLRHVLPESQQWSGNRSMIVRTVTSLLGTGDWLRHLATAALPRRPNGSAVVAVTETAVAIADLDHTFRITRQLRVESTELTSADLTPRRRLGLLATADVLLHTTAGPSIELLGMFGKEAEELMENLRTMR
ncbi:MAG: TIR domain-containing protein [Pseudonocardiaceae bacterium]